MADVIDIHIEVTDSQIALGTQGENGVRRIVFNIAPWVAELGEGTIVLLHQRALDEYPYAVPIERDGNAVYWTVSYHDTEQPLQYGNAELRYYSLGTGTVPPSLLKSRAYQTSVNRDPSGSGVPHPMPPGLLWLDTLALEAFRAEAAKDGAEAAREGAENAQTAAEAAQSAAESARDDSRAAREEAQNAQYNAEDACYTARRWAIGDPEPGDGKSAKSYALDSRLWANGPTLPSDADGDEKSARAWAEDAGTYASNAHTDAIAAQSAIYEMSFVTFLMDTNGHVIVTNGERIGSTRFTLLDNGHLQVATVM